MWEWLFSLEQRRRKLLRRCPTGPLADFLGVPFPDPARECREVEYLAIDLETTGLDPRQHEILSVGFTPVRQWRVALADSAHYLVRPSGAIPEESAVLHRIFDDISASGEALEAVLPRVLEQMAGRVLLAHHARVEMGFLSAACRRLYGCPFLAPVVDTLGLERRWLVQRGHVVHTGGLRLGTLRNYYHLPRYPAHNALSDALAAAELFLAQVEHRSGGHPMQLKRLLG